MWGKDMLTLYFMFAAWKITDVSDVHCAEQLEQLVNASTYRSCP